MPTVKEKSPCADAAASTLAIPGGETSLSSPSSATIVTPNSTRSFASSSPTTNKARFVSFVIYAQPQGYAPKYIMRRWVIGMDSDELREHGGPWGSDDIAVLRKGVPDFMRHTPRRPGDPELVVETWI